MLHEVRYKYRIIVIILEQLSAYQNSQIKKQTPKAKI